MAPEGFREFFLATAGAGAALIGLLFVAITIGPERTFGASDRMGPPRQHLAEAALITMVNGFAVCCVALIPGVNVGWIAFLGGLWGAVGCTLGASLSYWVGYFGGRPLVDRFGKFIMINHDEENSFI